MPKATRTHSPRAAAPQPDPKCCPAEKIGREIAELWDARSRLNEREVKVARDDPALSARLDILGSEVFGQAEALATALAAVRTRSALGAMAQIIQAYSLFDLIVGGSEGERDERLKFEGCLYSVLMFLEEMTGVSAEEMGARQMMSGRSNPHLLLQRARAA